MSEPRPDGVLLLEGLSRFGVGMIPLARRLRRAGFETTAPGYDSRGGTVESAACYAAERAGGRGWRTVHAVGHSLGGIVASMMITRLDPPPGAVWGRVVQLGAPNAGTEVAAMLNRVPFARAFLGPTLDQMAIPRETYLAASADARIGAISAARYPGPLGLLCGLPRPNDGLVSVASGFGRARHRTLAPSGHALYPWNRAVAAATIAFLRDGRFDAHACTEPSPFGRGANDA